MYYLCRYLIFCILFMFTYVSLFCFFFPGKFSHIWGHFWLSQLRGGGVLLVSSTGAAKRARMTRTIHNRKLSRPDCPLGQSWEMLFSREIKKKKKTIKGLKSLMHGMLETRRSYIILNRWQCWRQRNDKIYKDTWIIFQNRLNVFCEFKTLKFWWMVAERTM